VGRRAEGRGEVEDRVEEVLEEVGQG
jgi:hypothetical protein